MITDYLVMKCIEAKELEVKVKMHIEAGWQPLGGVTFSSGYYIQALVKYREDTFRQDLFREIEDLKRAIRCL